MLFEYSTQKIRTVISLGGDGKGIDLTGLDMGPEAFDISSLLGGGDGKEIDFSQITGDDGKPLGIDTTGLDKGEGAFDISSVLSGGTSDDLAKTDWESLYKEG